MTARRVLVALAVAGAALWTRAPAAERLNCRVRHEVKPVLRFQERDPTVQQYSIERLVNGQWSAQGLVLRDQICGPHPQMGFSLDPVPHNTCELVYGCVWDRPNVNAILRVVRWGVEESAVATGVPPPLVVKSVDPAPAVEVICLPPGSVPARASVDGKCGGARAIFPSPTVPRGGCP